MKVKVKSVLYSYEYFLEDEFNSKAYARVASERGLIIDGTDKLNTIWIKAIMKFIYGIHYVEINSDIEYSENNTMLGGVISLNFIKDLRKELRKRDIFSYLKAKIKLKYMFNSDWIGEYLMIIIPRFNLDVDIMSNRLSTRYRFKRFNRNMISDIINFGCYYFQFRLVKKKDILFIKDLDEWEIDIPGEKDNMYVKFIKSFT
jgi:hypothetical protein